MAGEWIKMRVNLVTHPKVLAIAQSLARNGEYQDWSTMAGFSPAIGGSDADSARDFQSSLRVTRYVTVCALLRFWGYANEHARDEFIGSLCVRDIDDVVQVPGFGAALEEIGWVRHDAERDGLELPNFNEYNTSGRERSAGAKSAAQRQREYRDRKKSLESDVTRDVTRDVKSDVTRDRREEKRREESNTPQPPQGGAPAGFDDFWALYPRHTAKANAMKAWVKVPVSLHGAIFEAVKVQSRSANWLKDGGQFIPHAASWLNAKRWEDEVGVSARRSDSGWLAGTGFDNEDEARNFGCTPSTASQFRDGRRIAKVPA